MGKNFIIFVLILPFMTLLSIFIFNEYIQTKKTVFNVLEEHLINQKISLLKNFSEHLSQEFEGNIQGTMSYNPDLYKHYEDELSLVQGPEIKYLYLLYKDKNNKFRYLLDTTKNINDKAEFNQKFGPSNKYLGQYIQ